MRNKSIVIKSPGNVAVVESEMPKPAKGEVLLKTLYGGICGSDLNTYRGLSPYVTYPRVPGHEFSAEIIEIEENTLGLKKGMLVTANPYYNCGHCYSCQRGLVNCCESNQTMGVQREGGFSLYQVLPIERIYAGQGLSAKQLVLVEPFCISYHGVKQANVKEGESVLIVGAGTIGILAAVTAKHLGAKVYVCDVSQDKLDYALKLGVDGTILNDTSENFDKNVKDITNSNGFDVTIEAVGLPSTFQNAIDAAAFGGRVVLIGVGKDNLDFNFTMIQKKELHIIGSRNATKQNFLDVMNIISLNNFNIDSVVTNVFKFEEAVRAFEEFDKNAGSMLKVILEF